MTSDVRPRVTLHFAQSLDGRIGLPGLRTPLSSPAGFELAHRVRAEHDAVLVGRRTVEIDDPRLCAAPPEARQPRRIVLASGLDVPAEARCLHGGPGTLVIGVRDRALPGRRAGLADMGVELRLVGAGPDGAVSLHEALAAIYEWGIRRLLVEGGARVLSSFLRYKLADEATIEIVPRFLGTPAIPAIGDIGVACVDGAVAFEDARVERAQGSIVVRGRLAY